MRLSPLALGAALALLKGCQGPSSPPPLELEARVSGCDEVRSGGVCVAGAGAELRAWVELPAGSPVEVRADGSPVGGRADGARLEVRADGAPVEVRAQGEAGGVRVTFALPAGASGLELLARAGGREAVGHVRVEAPADEPWLAHARALRAEGKLDEAASGLREALVSLEGQARARALSLLGRVELARGESEAAARTLREARAAHRASGSLSGDAGDGFALVYALLYRGRKIAEARAELATAAESASAYADGEAELPYYEGLLSLEGGDLRGALERLGECARRAERLGRGPLRAMADETRAEVLAELGRPDEARALVEGALVVPDGSTGACSRAKTLVNAGWLSYLAALRSRGSMAEAEARFVEGLSLFERGCPSPDERANVLANLSLVALERGDLALCRARLASARESKPRPDPRLGVVLDEIEGRLASRAGDHARALSLFDRMEALAASTSQLDARYRAHLGRARALASLGRASAASAAFSQAEATLDTAAALVPLGEGRDRFVAAREAGAREHMEFLLSRGRPDEALAAARKASSRLLSLLSTPDRLASLPPGARAGWEQALSAYREGREALEREASGDWALAADKLRAAREARKGRDAALRAGLDAALSSLSPRPFAEPRPPARGELLLAYFPTEAGVCAFASEPGQTRALRVVLPEGAGPERLSASLLEPFAEAIGRAERVTVIAPGAMAGLDVHALPLAGKPLVAHLPVAYGLDAGEGSGSRAGQGEGEPRAVIVADPSGNLPQARAEAGRVSARVEQIGLSVAERLEGGAAARARVTHALPGARLLHYAGHAVFAGREGWESKLPLAQGTELRLADLLALPSAPLAVVLSGCETARSSTDAPAQGLGLAQAFVLAGAGQIVAATRPVDDALASRLMELLYDNAGPDLDLARALARAEATLARDAPESDWASFRALVP